MIVLSRYTIKFDDSKISHLLIDRVHLIQVQTKSYLSRHNLSLLINHTLIHIFFDHIAISHLCGRLFVFSDEIWMENKGKWNVSLVYKKSVLPHLWEKQTHLCLNIDTLLYADSGVRRRQCLYHHHLRLLRSILILISNSNLN